VGDDDQAIYGWRGAPLDNLAALPRDYPDIKVVKLEQNYRSTVRILRCANALIGNNPKLFDKQLWSDLGTGDKIHVASRPTTRRKPRWCCTASRRSSSSGGELRRFRDPLSRQPPGAGLRDRAARAGTSPTTSPAASRCSSATEIKDIVAYLRLIANDDDDPAFLRAVGAPKRGMARRRSRGWPTSGAPQGEPVRRGVRARARLAVPARQREALSEFCKLVNDLRYRAEREPAGRLLNELMAASATRRGSSTRSTSATRSRAAKSVRDFTDWLSRKGEADGRNLIELTQHVALITMLESRDGERRRTVRLSTLHAAKGSSSRTCSSSASRKASCRIARRSTQATSRKSGASCTSASRARDSRCTCHGAVRKRRGREGGVPPSRFIGELAQEDSATRCAADARRSGRSERSRATSA
jgi:ATP-dependent DNA helicase Rep